jgi:superfamily I DNA/RNA helicase
MASDDFDYDSIAARYLQQVTFERVRPRCQAMFIDEAQDMGPNTLQLLAALVEPTDPTNLKGRAVNIFYDDAQNIYGRARPKWSEIGLDIVGRRSTVMKESFRSTRPITEFALNVLYRLQPPDTNADYKELLDRGLIERTQTAGGPWWNVRFNQIEGPVPIFRKFASLDDQIDALGKQVVHWIGVEGVKAGNICIVYNGNNIKLRLEQQVVPMLQEIGSSLTFFGKQGWSRSENSVLASTSHSYKGFDSEVIVIAGVEQFIASETILANNLYVAMTRARSILAVYACSRKYPDKNTQTLLSTLQKCIDVVERSRVEVELESGSKLSDFEDLLGRLGDGRRDWLAKLWKSYLIQQEPIIAKDGEILAEPLFWFQVDDRVVACFGDEDPGTHTRHKLEDNRVDILVPGQNPPGPAPG